MSAYRRGLMAVLTGVWLGCPMPSSAQVYRIAVDLSYSLPMPLALRSEMKSQVVVGSASKGGPMVRVGVERGTGVVWGVEAVYSRHSSLPDDFLEQRGVEFVFAAEKEETVGVMVTVSVPVVEVWRRSPRVSASAGLLRTELQGKGTIGGDAFVSTEISKVAPAMGVGLELPIPCQCYGLYLSLRGAQLITSERGGGYLAFGAGFRW